MGYLKPLTTLINELRKLNNTARLCGRTQAIPPQQVIVWENLGLFCALTVSMEKSSQNSVERSVLEVEEL